MSAALARARAIVRRRAPYWSAALYGFSYAPVPGCGTMFVTEKGVVGYDPNFVAEQGADDLAFVLAHEVVHFVLGHPHRRGDREPRMWNCAADLAVNDLLCRAGWTPADGALLPSTFSFPEALSADQYYSRLAGRAAEQPQDPEGPDKEGERGQTDRARAQGGRTHESQNGKVGTNDAPAASNGARGSTNNEDGSGAGPESEPGGAKGPADVVNPKVGSGACGGVAGAAHDESLEQELDRTYKRCAADEACIQRAVASAIREHVKALGPGSVPGDLEEWATVRDAPSKVRWEEELERVISESLGSIRGGNDDYSLRRPSRRSFFRGMLRPGLIDQTPNVAFVVDTSGSMNTAALGAAMAEAVAILRDLRLEEVWFAQADMALVKPFERVGLDAFDGSMEFHGRGGTSFVAALAAATKLEPRPDVLVYFTDGDGRAPDEPPSYPVVWCLLPLDGCRCAEPPAWGHRVHVPAPDTPS